MMDKKPSVILVCGGRSYGDRYHVYETLNRYRTHIFAEEFVIVQGGAKYTHVEGPRGADFFAKEWALSIPVPCMQFDAPWKSTYGKTAGLLRNLWMLKYAHPDLVIAFPGGNGTAHMVKNALAAGIPVHGILEKKS